jgi:hypothetical protein
MRVRIVLAGCLAAALLWASPARAEDDDDSPGEKVEAVVETGNSRAGVQPEVGAPAKVGLLHDTLSRAKKQPTLLQKVSDEYSDLKTRMEDEHGLTWSFSLSYRQRWVHPDNIGTSSQTLFWPSLNWDIFDSEAFGAGSFQFLYYGERRSGSKVTVSRGSRTLSGELPDYQNKFSQITYTHTLPGEMFAVAVGQYSFFNFDSSEFMADQQLNFVNNIFSANGSATYPTTGTGGYVQFNATKTLQFLAGVQSVNIEDPTTRPTDGFLSSPYAWLGYVQWTPAFKGLGDAQYSLTLYQSPAVTDHSASRGWSINAVQHLNDQWAIFGRLNASTDDSGGHKRSFGIGVALNNPLGRAAGDQIGIAFGSLEQQLPLPLPLLNLKHTQNTLEAYWNWSLFGGLLLTPDVQYIRNPAFAADRDSAWISSLRATLVF